MNEQDDSLVTLGPLMRCTNGITVMYMVEVKDAVFNAKYSTGTYFWRMKPSNPDFVNSQESYNQWRKVKSI